jgi:hypothetical protein
MAQETALYRADVEQVRRRFAEWRGTHVRCDRGCRKSYGLEPRSWSSAMGSMPRRGRGTSSYGHTRFYGQTFSERNGFRHGLLV